MQFMNLGQTGLVVSTVGFGGIPIIRLGFPEAETVLRHAVDQGITFFDTANKYLDSEEKMGRAFAGIRDKLVIATKTGQRRAKEAMAELELSLTRLNTDYIDLYQPHQVSLPEELEALLAPGGAMEALVRAREQGKIRHALSASPPTTWRWPASLWPPGFSPPSSFRTIWWKPRRRRTFFPRPGRRALASWS